MAEPVILVHSNVPEQDTAVREIILAEYPQLTVLTAHGEAEVAERLPQADILFAWELPVHLLPLATRLRWFQVMGAGLEKLADAPLPHGVVVTNVRGVFGGSMTEYVLTYTLAHYQNLRGILEQQARHAWEPFTPVRLAGKTIGIIGLGSIGREIAATCTGLGMRAIGVNRQGTDVPGLERVYPVAGIDTFLPECDILVTVVPHTRETTGLLTRERLRLLKPECFYINIGRGNVVALDHITEALREGWIAGAALDVFPTEPLDPGHPLWDLPNVFITPHISGVNRPNDVTDIFLANLRHYLAGEPLENVVDLARGY